ncbi:MAG: hypothetical protein WAK71_09835 [Streptosporangiaceae bacterium]
MDIEREVLSLLAEDYYSPWEIAIQVPVRRQDLGRVIARLIQAGLAEWFARSEDSAPAIAWSDLSLPTPDLADDQTWEAAALRERQILVGITDAGKKAYYGV